MQQAQQQIDAASQPIEDQIAQEKAANLAKAKAQMGFAQAAAAIAGQMAPRIQDAYTGAANADAGYARGLGDQVQAQLNQQQGANNDFLAKMGTPQAGLQSAPPVGDMSYGLEGYIPASTLQREGAGFTAAANMMPANLLHAGQQEAQQIQMNDPNLASLQNDLAKLAATQPAVYQQILSALNTQAYHQQELALGKGRLNLAAQLGYGRLAQGQQSLNLRAQSLANTQAYHQQSLALRARQMANSNAQAWARIGISKGNLRLRAATLEAKLHGGSGGGSGGGGGTGGFTPNEIRTIKEKAAPMAVAAYNGTQYKDPTTGKIVHVKPYTYKAAMKYMITRGVPPSIADNELRAAGYHHGDGFGTPKDSPFLTLGSGVPGGPLGHTANSIVGLAREYLGTPYVWGGESPKGFDCSGFAQYLYGKVGISIPRTTYTQWQTGTPVGKGQLQPGDLVFFRGGDSRGGLPGHVGVYIGGGKMIDAPHTGANVRIESVNGFGGYMGARRYR